MEACKVKGVAKSTYGSWAIKHQEAQDLVEKKEEAPPEFIKPATEQQRFNLFNTVYELAKEIGTKEACVKHGLTYATYASWKNRYRATISKDKPRKQKPKLIEIPIDNQMQIQSFNLNPKIKLLGDFLEILKGL